MQATALLHTIEKVIQNMPTDWLKLTTHRLDIYDEQQAKTEFLQEFEALVASDTLDTTALSNLPTAYDYIRLGHPLSSVLEWVLGNIHNLNAEAVISFDSITMPVLAILRTNLLAGKTTKIYHSDPLPELFDQKILQEIYGYQFTTEQVK
ncbi:MAG: cystathionine beta-synthase, partial [Aquimarina sp.]|nr:cystathionine beta-synthase [Aquimarina sp.]